MKSVLPYSLCLLLGSVFFFSCGSENPDQAGAAALAPGVEEKIDLVNHPLSEARGLFQIATCKDSILIDSLGQLPPVADSIRIGAFTAMQDSALKLKGNFTGNYLRALRVIYGLDESNTKMKLYYQPVFLKRITPTGTTSIVFEPKASPNYYYYRYTDTSFVYESDIAKVDSAKARYARRISFKKVTGKFRRFNPGMTDTSDVMASIFPFQEIKQMVQDNKATHVYIINSGEDIPVGTKSYMRHVMILGPDSLGHRFTDIFFRKYANLSHLCPPNCAQHIFNLKPIAP